MPRTRLPLFLAALVVVAIVGGFALFQQFLAGDDVARLTLPPATSSAAVSADPSAATADPATAPSASGDPIAGTATPAELAGSWSIADGSIVGYRVRERLGGVSALTDAVGRTTAVTGSATLEASGKALTVTAGSFEADLTQLQSDDSRRDNRIRSIGLESSTFPTATFVLSDPIEVPASGLAGGTVDVTLTGDLTIHGQTNHVSIPAQAQLSGGQVQIAGSLTFAFGDFGMTPPDIAGFVQVEDEATLEVLILLAKA